MHHTSTITSKGQTTIPADIRNLLNLKTGDKIRFFVQENGHITIVPLTVSLSDLKGILPKPQKAVTIEEMNEAVKKHAAERYISSIS